MPRDQESQIFYSQMVLKMDEPQVNLVEQTHWNHNWEASELSQPMDISPGIMKNPQHRRLHLLLRRFLSNLSAETKLLEVGCANSYFLPYFAKEYGFSVTGLDYSKKGCEQAKAILTRGKIDGKIICSDMFTPPDEMREAFDIVVSFGVIEHFMPTTRALRALNVFLRPGGIIVTLIPSMNGLVGFMQKRVNREIYDLHVPLTKKSLLAAHRTSGFDCLFCNYYTFANFFVVNTGNKNCGIWGSILKALRLLSKASWLIENITHWLPSNRYSSPYVVCVAKKINSA